MAWDTFLTNNSSINTPHHKGKGRVKGKEFRDRDKDRVSLINPCTVLSSTSNSSSLWAWLKCVISSRILIQSSHSIPSHHIVILSRLKSAPIILPTYITFSFLFFHTNFSLSFSGTATAAAANDATARCSIPHNGPRHRRGGSFSRWSQRSTGWNLMLSNNYLYTSSIPCLPLSSSPSPLPFPVALRDKHSNPLIFPILPSHHSYKQPAYYVQQPVYLDQNGQPVYYRVGTLSHTQFNPPHTP